MATGEIRLSILWEWIHKGATLTEADAGTGCAAGDAFTAALFARLLEEEYAKLRQARNKDVHDDSKDTTLPIARAIVETYVGSDIKAPWYVDLLNLNLGVEKLAEAEQRIARFLEAFKKDGTRLTENLDF
jgi:malate synthase